MKVEHSKLELSTSDGNANISASNGNTFGVYVEETRKLHVEDGTTSISNDLSVSGATTLNAGLDVTGALSATELQHLVQVDSERWRT